MMVKEMLDAEAGVYTIGSDRAEREEHRQMHRQTAVQILVPRFSCLTPGRSFLSPRLITLLFQVGKKNIL